MKTLKKTLCLVLAVVMAVGVLVIPANAVDFDDLTDKDEIKHAEAVMVLNGMGILTGKDDGSFDPTGTLSRNQAAKIVAYAHGGAALAESYGKTETLFNDVPANGYYTGFINYVAMNGLVGGDGAGNFMPTKSLTGYQLGKMMLLAAGIGVESDYSGSGWTMKVNNALVRNGLLEDLTVDLSKAITRDDAAQLLWNVMNYSEKGESSVFGVYASAERDADQITTTSDPMEVLSYKAAGYVIRVITTKADSLAGRNYGFSTATGSDAWGRSTVQYTNGRTDNRKVIYASFDATPSKTYLVATNLDTILKDLGYKLNGKVSLTIYKNGVEITDYTEYGAASDKTFTRTSDTANSKRLGGTGTLVEVFKYSGDAVRVDLIETHIYKLTADDITAHKAATADTNEVPASITINGCSLETDKFKKNDIVVYTANEDTKAIVDIAIAGTVSGKVTATGSGYIRIDGTQTYVSQSAKALADGKFTADVVVGSTAGFKYDATTNYVFYLDFYKNVIGAEPGKVQEIQTDYVYVQAFEASAGEKGGGDLITTAGTAAVAKARVIHLDGTVQVVDIGIVRKPTGDYEYADYSGAASGKAVTGSSDYTGGKFYEYVTLADGSYVLVADATGDTENVNLVKGTAKIADGLFANSSTVATVMVYKDGKTTVTKITGYNSFPSSNGVLNGALVFANAAGTVSEIYAVTSAPVGSTEAPVHYAIYAGAGETTNVAHIQFYVDGALVEYEYKGTTALVPGTVYDITVSGNEVTKADPITTGKTENVSVVSVEAEYFVGKNATSTEAYTFASNCLIVDANASYAKAALEVDDVVTIFVKDGKVELVIITK